MKRAGFNASWTPSPMHKVGVTYKQGLVRPSYLQVCWFPRIGAYANEVQVGNPDLKPSGNGRASLFYTFHSGFFTGTLEGIGKVSWDRMAVNVFFIPCSKCVSCK